MFKGRKKLFTQIGIFMAILGPGIITGSVDNDAGGITTYAVAGADYGYTLLWTLIPAFIVLLVIQEMNARMGVVTGKGLADLIRENAGVKITFFIFIGLLIADIGNTTTEFAGVAGSMEVFGVSKYISVPIVAALVWILVVKGTYKIAERIFLLFSVSLLTYVISAIMGKPHWGEIGTAIINPHMEFNTKSLAMVIGIIGTTIAPWMQFYMQSSVIEKGLKMKNFKYTLIDIVIGCVATVVVAFFIMVACASTLHENGIKIEEAKDAALALKPLAGNFASQVFAFGLFVASVFSATILPLATAFYVCEAFGFEAGIDKKWDDAPEFYIFSDDITWARENLKIGFPCVYIDHNQGLENYNDMRLMSLCKHHIIANSSFSWWGAWLNPNPGKIVIAPKKWFANEIKSDDLIPANWIAL